MSGLATLFSVMFFGMILKCHWQVEKDKHLGKLLCQRHPYFWHLTLQSYLLVAHLSAEGMLGKLGKLFSLLKWFNAPQRGFQVLLHFQKGPVMPTNM